MDIVDSQAHLGPGGAAEMVAAMDALGIAAVLIDEWWMGKTLDPGYHLPNGAFRPTAPTAELASWTYPGRFSYQLSVDPPDPELESQLRQLRDAAYCRALRIAPGINRTELQRFGEGD
jgi:L-fuconolactonase